MDAILRKAIQGGYDEGRDWKFLGANIYWAQWLNGNGDRQSVSISEYFLFKPFWESLGKACGWIETKPSRPTVGMIDDCMHYAIVFHKMNLLEGRIQAIAWLEELISK
mgnify:CR=1 FL=1